MFVILSLFLLCQFGQSTRYGVSLIMAGPLEPVDVTLFVRNNAAPCCTSSAKPVCCAPPRPNYVITEENSTLAVSWGGCSESSNSPDCYSGFASPSTSALITVNSPIGNCSVAINRTTLQPNQCMGINGMGQCTYGWYVLIRNCGAVNCIWNPTNQQIAITCYDGNCVSPTSIPLNSCSPVSQNPWLYDPSYYNPPSSLFKCFKDWTMIF